MSTQVEDPVTRRGKDGAWVRRVRRGMLRISGWRVAPLVLLAIVLAFASPLSADRDEGRKSFTTFTQNAYVGASLERVMLVDPNDFPGLIKAVTTTYYELLASQPDLRMNGIADRIAARIPDVVALQEMYLVRKQSPGDLVFGGTEPATEVVVDFLKSLMDGLAARGLHYRVAAMTTELDVEMPMFNATFDGFDDARVTDRDIILVRTDLPHDQFRVSNPRGGHFETHLTLPNGLDVWQGWCSVDVFVRGERFRFINTHLHDEAIPEIQYAQALELMAKHGPADTHLPVMMVGDFNADPLGRNLTWTYPSLIAGGFDDAWSALYPNRPGLTWGHDAYLADPSLAFVWRIDLVLLKGQLFIPKRMMTIDTPLGGPTYPFWPSDHAGVWAKFELR